jgi:serine O-acetyltransferase
VPSFSHLVRADLHRYGGAVSVRAFMRCYWTTPGFNYTFWLRLANHLRRQGKLWRPLHLLCRALLHRKSIKYGISIAYNTRIGPGLYIGHFGGIVVNDQVVLGMDCNLNHGVTLGMKYGGKRPGVPVIGDRVYLGPGSVVIGGIRVGNDVAVGANSVVVDSVPDGGVVAGAPARLVSRKGSHDYVVNTGYAAADSGGAASVDAHVATRHRVQ